MLDEIKDAIKRVFEMTNLGLMKYFLEITKQCTQDIFICQQNYLTYILKKFRMEKCKPTETPFATIITI